MICMARRSRAALSVALLLLSAGSLQAQSTVPEPDLDGFLIAGWNTRVLNVPAGFLPVEPPNAGVGHTFQVMNARIYLRGQVDERFGYDFKTELSNGFNLLMGFVTWKVDDRLTVSAGKLLKPFNRDRLLPQHTLKSLTRTVTTLQVSHTLQYGFVDTGVMLSFRSESGFTFRTGLFNAAGAGAVRDTDTGKNLVVRTTLPLGSLEIGANASWIHLGHTVPSGGRDNLALGIDALLSVGSLTLEGEIIRADAWNRQNPVTNESPGLWSASLTGALPLPRPAGAPGTELVLRLERLDPDEDIEQDEWFFLVPSLNLSLSSASRLMAGLVTSLPMADNLDPSVSGVVQWRVIFF